MADLIQIAQDSKAALGPIVLEQGEPGFFTDTNELVIGNGLEDAADLVVVANNWEVISAGVLNSTGTTTLGAPLNRRTLLVSLTTSAGAGAHTRKIVLPVTGTNRRPGDECRIKLVMPASANPTLQFHTTDGSTTALAVIPPDALVARTYFLSFVFNGAAWELFDVRQVS